MEPVELSLLNNKTDNTDYNDNVYVDIVLEEKKKQHDEHFVRKVGGGGPEIPNFVPMLLTLISVLFFTILNECVATVMYTDLVNEFNMEITTIQWVTTAFVLVLAIGMVFSSFIAKHLYMRTIFFLAVTFFVSGSLLCAIAQSLIVLLVGRVIQGLGTALLMPQISNVIVIMSPRDRVGFYNGVSMVVMITGSALGPTLSGLITRYFGWRYVFALLIPIPLIGGIAGYWTVGNIVVQEDSKLDILSVILAILGYGGISYGLGNSGDYGFSSLMVTVSLSIGIVSLVSFFFWQYFCKNPLVNIRNLGKPVFICNVLLCIFIISHLVGWLAIIPFIIQNYLGYTSLVSGLALLPGGVINAFLNLVGGKIYDKTYFKYGPVGIALVLIGSIYFFYLFITNRVDIWNIVFGYIVGNLGIPLVGSIYSTSSLTSVPPQSTPHAGAVFHSLYQLTNALCSAVYVALFNNFNTITFGKSDNPLVNGGAVCFLLTAIISGICLIASIIWSCIYFKNHDNKGNPK